MLGVVRSSLKMVKFEPTTPNMLQHIATQWPKTHNIQLSVLRYVVLACCDRLARAYLNTYDILEQNTHVTVYQKEFFGTFCCFLWNSDNLEEVRINFFSEI